MNRLDKELVIRNLAPTRSKAQELLRNKNITLNGKVITKDSTKIKPEDELVVLRNNTLKFVSRGGLKLEKAIKKFKLNFEGANILDIGSSTGGFTDCALQYKANKVLAVDVGTDLMDEKLKNNEKITLLEKTNFKYLEPKYFENIDFIIADVSFISLKLLIDKIEEIETNCDLVFLIKPQFECGKEIADKYKGIILNKPIHVNILNGINNYFKTKGYYLKNITHSPIQGGDGNIEYIAHFNTTKNETYHNFVSIVDQAFRAGRSRSR